MSGLILASAMLRLLKKIPNSTGQPIFISKAVTNIGDGFTVHYWNQSGQEARSLINRY